LKIIIIRLSHYFGGFSYPLSIEIFYFKD